MLLTAVVFLLSPGSSSGATNGEPEPSADARIAHYSARARGRGSWAAHARLGLAYLDRGRETGSSADLRAAERHLRRSQEWQPNHEALLGLATLEAARHRFDAAEAHARAALEALPGDAAATGVLCEVALARGDVEEAARLVEQLLARGRTFASVARLAALREYRGDASGALEALDEACALEEGSRLAWCDVRRGALALAARCDAAAAEYAYRAALGRLPGYWAAREHLAELALARGRRQEARELYEGLVAEPGGAAYRLALAGLLDADGMERKARRQRRRALDELRRSVESGSPEHEREYVMALVAEGSAPSVSTALDVAREATDSRRDGLTLDALGWALHAAGLEREAGEAYAEALATGSRNPGLLLRAAHVASALGRGDEARRLAHEALACPVALEPGDRRLAEALGAE